MKLRQHLLLLFVVLTGTLYGQTNQVPYKEASNKVYFRMGEKQLDLNYKDNGKTLEALIKSLNALSADSTCVLSNVKIAGIASIDGKTETANLAQGRSEAIKSYITSQLSFPLSQIEIDNRGEDWQGLRSLVSASPVPGKKAVLRILDNVKNRVKCKSQLMKLQGGAPYKYILRNLYPVLQCNFSISSSYSSVMTIRQRNWEILQHELSSSVLPDADKKALLSLIFSHASDSEESLRQMENLVGGETIEKVKSSFLSKILFTPDSINTKINNWLLLEKMSGASSDIPYKKDVLRLFSESPLSQLREEQLKTLHEGVCYQYMKDHFFSRLLQNSSIPDSAEILSVQREGGWRLLRYLVNTSTIETKGQVLDVIDHNADPSARLDTLIRIDKGTTYRYLCDMYLPSLLYNRKSNNQDIWNPVKREVTSSNMPEREQVLSLIDSVQLFSVRERRLRSLNGGETYRTIQDRLFLNLLTGRDTASVQRLIRLRRSTEVGTPHPPVLTDNAPVVQPYSRLALKTNLLYWAGVTSEFDHHYMTPNVSLEYFFCKRWSLNAEGIYTHIDKKDGDNEIWANSDVSLEPRYWLKGDQRFKGFFVGAYGLYGDFDVKLNSLSTTNGYTGNYYEGGLSLGYYLQIFEGFGLELGARGGYRNSSYDTYFVRNGHHYTVEKSLSKNEIGLTGIHISLNYRIGKASKKSGNENK